MHPVTYLFVPGTEDRKIAKAMQSDADAVILDLEDSIADDMKEGAREHLAGYVRSLQPGSVRAEVWVRINSDDSLFPADVKAIPWNNVHGAVLPKAERRESITALIDAGAKRVLPIIESAAGVLGCAGIAEVTGVACLALGRFDLAADLGIDPDGASAALTMARASVVLASTAGRIDPPLDSPWLKIADLDGLRAAAEQARADGFGGMLVIHPSHLETVNQVFSPTADELVWARGIVASSAEAESGGRGAYTRDGEMVDEAVVKRARAILRDTQP